VPERRKPAGRFILYTVYFILEPVGRSLAATKGVRLGRGLHGASYFILYTLYILYAGSTVLASRWFFWCSRVAVLYTLYFILLVLACGAVAGGVSARVLYTLYSVAGGASARRAQV